MHGFLQMLYHCFNYFNENVYNFIFCKDDALFICILALFLFDIRKKIDHLFSEIALVINWKFTYRN